MTRLSITSPLAALRFKPTSVATLENECLWGEQFVVDDYQNGFAHGKLSHDGYEGWVDKRSIGQMPDSNARVIALMTHVTRHSDIKSNGLYKLSIGAHVAILDSDKKFTKIATPEGFGFLPSVHLSRKKKIFDDWPGVVERFYGIPYKWGGRSAFGIDCSGLVQICMNLSGHCVPRDSGPQSSIGVALKSVDMLERGDLIFWRGHVGVMLNRKELIHANAYHMAVMSEPLATALKRIEKEVGPITALRRP